MIQHSKPTIQPCDFKAIASCLKSGWLAQGRYVQRFEEAIRRYVGTQYAVATNSGTSALHLALLALGITRGDEVIVPGYVCSSVLNAVNYTGATPVIVDIDESDLNISIETTRKRLTKHTKSIIVPHQFGFPAEVKSFIKLGIPVIEDCAQSIGAQYHGKPVGSWGTIAIFSFYATKMLTTGYGGMVTSNSTQLIHRIKDLRDFDERDNYITRYNYQMSDVVASLGLEQLDRLNGFIKRRQRIARIYSEILKDAPCQLPQVQTDTQPVFFRYVIRISGSLEPFIKAMRQKGIEVKRPVYKPIPRYLGLNKRDFPITEKVYSCAISLPIYPNLPDSKAVYVGRLAKQILTRVR
jgi:dTDP-4-amino-4,6-dideoxygalactose transaminase